MAQHDAARPRNLVDDVRRDEYGVVIKRALRRLAAHGACAQTRLLYQVATENRNAGAAGQGRRGATGANSHEPVNLKPPFPKMMEIRRADGRFARVLN
jgi:hypothetical protein